MIYGREDRIRELQAEIDRLRAEQDAPPVWVPDNREVYYIAEYGSVDKSVWLSDYPERSYLRVGNVFKTERQANDHLRALALIETIRRERYKAQGHWWPGEYETRYTVCWKQLGNSIDTSYASLTFSSNVFGFWRDLDVLYGVIKKYESELKWYFTEHLPSIN